MVLENDELIPGSTEEDYIKRPGNNGVEVMLVSEFSLGVGKMKKSPCSKRIPDIGVRCILIKGISAESEIPTLLF